MPYGSSVQQTTETPRQQTKNNLLPNSGGTDETAEEDARLGD
jgi:hypothetical protein